MAGLDVIINCRSSLQREVEDWLRFFQRLCDEYQIYNDSRIETNEDEQLHIEVSISGNIAILQFLDRQLSQEAVRFLRIYVNPLQLAHNCVWPFLNEYHEGVHYLSDQMFQLLSWVKDNAPQLPELHKLQTAELIISPESSKLGTSQSARGREERAKQSVVRVIDGWLSGQIRENDAIILCDQAIEDWLKGQLGLPKTSRAGFQEVTRIAQEERLITKMQAYRLKRFHKARNRIQHRGGAVKSTTVVSFLDYAIRLFDSTLMR
jgi:hypothetical protein